MTYAWDNDSTQNAHIKQMRDDRQRPTWKNTERIRHMRDLNICRIMEKEYKTNNDK